MYDNPPLNKDNIISAVSRVAINTRNSKAGKPYTVATVYLKNGYSWQAFLDENQQNAVRLALTEVQQGSSPLDNDNSAVVDG